MTLTFEQRQFVRQLLTIGKPVADWAQGRMVNGSDVETVRQDLRKAMHAVDCGRRI